MPLQIRRKLESRLFYAKPKFCSAVMDIAVSAKIQSQSKLASTYGMCLVV